MGNCLICGERDGLKVVWTLCDFDELRNANVYEWTYGYTEKSWLTEEKAISLAKEFLGQPGIKNIKVIQPLADDNYFEIDFTKDEPEYHLKKNSPTRK